MTRCQVFQGDCMEVLNGFKDSSFDAVVTDPPYGLEFMGRDWDSFRPSGARIRQPSERAGQPFQQWCEIWAGECLRVLKPGGHLVAFGGTRTYHRLASGIEDAGFEIRDSLHWIYGSGFPKSLDISKAIDKAAGAEREVIRTRDDGWSSGSGDGVLNMHGRDVTNGSAAKSRAVPITAPATEDAARWDGWGTALKPAHEPIVLARKPLTGTVAANVLEYGTGALNIDGCRGSSGKGLGAGIQNEPEGRWPPNVLLTHSADCADQCTPGCPVAGLDAQSGISKSTGGKGAAASQRTALCGEVYGDYSHSTLGRNAGGLGDSGGASRFFPQLNWSAEYDLPFLYQAKASARERPKAGIAHPTVKPLALMRWLVRLVMPADGIVLDLFAGTGTTGEACLDEGFRCVLIEKEPEYISLIRKRLDSREPTLWDVA